MEEVDYLLKKGGNVGIGNTSPNSKLDVNGIISSHGRVGLYSLEKFRRWQMA